ncbi:MAG TPA: histidinol dehydrogenase [Bacteroidota bacterium]|nr:histidinol dehydrogenase [Bacteroidota bacterium]
MVRLVDLRSSRKNVRFQRTASRDSSANVETTVNAIIRRVQRRGDAALRFYSKKFEGAELRSFSVSEREILKARKNADPKFVRLLAEAEEKIRKFHLRQRRASWKIDEKFGSDLRQRYLPVDRVGVYVPGGKAAYPSTVLMNVIPAQVAGVEDIILVSPPDGSGNVNADVLTAAAILGVKKIFRVGGAQAIAALAYGTETIPAVDVIVGPGNIFVATAKKMLFGQVGIDSIAGPSEIVVLADDGASGEFVAADMAAQAEHDESASSILVTTSPRLAGEVQKALKDLLLILPRKGVIAPSLNDHGAIFLVRDLRQGAEVVNRLAPEHLEIITKSNEAVLKQIRNAGSIFLGNYSPVALGDYFAGPNHVLPTSGTARFFSPLSVDTFMKRSSVIKYSRRAMESASEKIARFAEHEGLTAHALSVRLRARSKGR